ncbi:MAG TPA: T9SS type A sorting domain-containing protein, partial [Ferruginibacter sp.]|nr:T9SS type A sorting domain-containing protein [Ferruginibacter sp.]
VVIVKNPGLQQNISPIRNPFVDRIDIRFTKLPKGEISMRLVDVAGRTLATNKLVNPVSPVIRFNYNESLSSGVYFLQVAAEGKQYSLKLVKQ